MESIESIMLFKTIHFLIFNFISTKNQIYSIDLAKSSNMFRTLIILLLLFFNSVSFSQSDLSEFDKKEKDRYGIWLIPSASRNIYGIATGFVGSESICNRPYTKHSHGINLQLIGQGIFQVFLINKAKFNDPQANSDSTNLFTQDTIPLRAIHNGLIVSPFGTFTDQVNGLSFSLWMSMGKKINGVSINLLWNFYEKMNGISIGLVNQTAETNGLQIGLVNKSLKLKGIQLGFWNKNEKRSLPIINWNFSRD